MFYNVLTMFYKVLISHPCVHLDSEYKPLLEVGRGQQLVPLVGEAASSCPRDSRARHRGGGKRGRRGTGSRQIAKPQKSLFY